MQVQSLISKVLYKCAPMSATEHEEIERNCAVWFEGQQKAVKEKIEGGGTLTMKDKFFNQINQWYFRALFAMAFIFIVRWVQDFMNPAEHDDSPELDSLDRR